MSGDISPFLEYSFMAWCSVKAQGQLYLYLKVKVPYNLITSVFLQNKPRTKYSALKFWDIKQQSIRREIPKLWLDKWIFRHDNKVKVKLCLCFNWAPRHGGVLEWWSYSSTHSLTSALDGGKRTDSRPGRFTPKERAPGTPWIGGQLGSITVLDAVVKRRIPSPRRETNPRIQIVQPVAQRYTDWAITAIVKIISLPIKHFQQTDICLYMYHWSRLNRPRVTVPNSQN
jgi:hypothetical protein